MKFRGTLDHVYALGRLKGEVVTNPDYPLYADSEEVLFDSQETVIDEEGRLVFVDDDGHCFVCIDGAWVEVEVTHKITVTPKHYHTDED